MALQRETTKAYTELTGRSRPAHPSVLALASQTINLTALNLMAESLIPMKMSIMSSLAASNTHMPVRDYQIVSVLLFLSAYF